jgi:hypothetical protein
MHKRSISAVMIIAKNNLIYNLAYLDIKLYIQDKDLTLAIIKVALKGLIKNQT